MVTIDNDQTALVFFHWSLLSVPVIALVLMPLIRFPLQFLQTRDMLLGGISLGRVATRDCIAGAIIPVVLAWLLCL